MAYDEDIAGRIRALLADEAGVTEKKMFGGLAFLIGGNMAVAADSKGGAMVRIDPAESERLAASPGAELMEMRGRRMDGWLHVDAEYLQRHEQLSEWVTLGVAYARSLPPKG